MTTIVAASLFVALLLGCVGAAADEGMARGLAVSGALVVVVWALAWVWVGLG